MSWGRLILLLATAIDFIFTQNRQLVDGREYENVTGE
jgi:hypothetical protein